jgi:hypothetical protein
MATSFSGGRSRSTQREPPTMGKQLVNFITCSCESSAPFFILSILISFVNLLESSNLLLLSSIYQTVIEYFRGYCGKETKILPIVSTARVRAPALYITKRVHSTRSCKWWELGHWINTLLSSCVCSFNGKLKCLNEKSNILWLILLN